MAKGDDKRLGKYILKSRLGQGGMGVVYLATDTRLQRDVAIKVLPKSLSSNEIILKRFLREARVAARLSHPNVVAVHDVDQQNGLCFLVMELVTGGTAQDRIEGGPIAWDDATRIIAEACRGLIAAHEANLIHRDIKPSNIMMNDEGLAKLADFGLAKITDDANPKNPLTKSGTIMGTPHYMSPEQCRGEALDVRSDLYSLGASYFALLTGRPPYTEDLAIQLMFAHCSKPLPDMRELRPDLPEGCIQVVVRAMEKDRSNRFQSAREMLAALNTLLTPGQLPYSVADTVSGTEINPPTRELNSWGGAGITPGSPTLAIDLPQSFNTQETQVVSLKPKLLTWWLGSPRGRWIVASVGVLAIFVSISWIAQSWFALRTTNNSSAVTQGEGSTNQKVTARSTPFQTGTKLELAIEIPGITSMVRTVAVSRDQQSLWTGDASGAVKQWSLQDGKLLGNLTGTRSSIRAVATAGKWIIAGGDAEEIWLWDDPTKGPEQTIRDFVTTGSERSPVNAISISPDGKRMGIASYSAFRLYELGPDGAKLVKLLGTSVSERVACYMIHQISFSADNEWVAAASWDQGTIAVWSTLTGDVDKVRVRAGRDIVALSFVPGKRQVLFGNDTDGVQSWFLDDDRVIPLAQDYRHPVRNLSVSRDGSWVASVGEWGGRMRLFDLKGNSPPRSLDHQTSFGALAVAINDAGDTLITTGGSDNQGGYVHIWKIVPDDARPSNSDSK